MSRDHHSEQEPSPADGLLAAAVSDPAHHATELAALRAERRRQRMLAFGVAFVVLIAAAALVAQVAFTDPGARTAGAPTIAVRGEAVAVTVIRPGSVAKRVAVAAPVAGTSRSEVAASARFALDASGSVAVVDRARSEASSSVGDTSAAAAVTAERISLFDGRIVITSAGMQADSSIVGGRASGAIELGVGTTVVVDGRATEATPNRQIAVEGIGTVLLNEQAVLASAPTGDAQSGPRHRVVGALAHVRLTNPVGDLPAGTEVIIGRVDAGVRQGKIKEIAQATTNPAALAPAPSGTGLGSIQSGSLKPGAAALPRQATAVRGSAATGGPRASLQNYVFPVLGTHAYTNDWGAPRASTGVPHQGNDIFADEGTPIVALADGVLDRVGWNTVGGYRFWLYDEFGNSFYHAHLSAYSPLAQDGARVKAGDVIGFVGHTGDAQGTPPHLHFEVHPGNGAPTNPFPFLNAWQDGVAVAIGLLAGGGESKTPALALLNFSDITANSGLGADVLGSVPDNSALPVDQETAPKPTDDTLRGAIDGPGISGQ